MKRKLTILGLAALTILAAVFFIIGGGGSQRRAAQSPKNKVVLRPDGKLAVEDESRVTMTVVAKTASTNASPAAPAPAKK